MLILQFTYIFRIDWTQKAKEASEFAGVEQTQLTNVNNGLENPVYSYAKNDESIKTNTVDENKKNESESQSISGSNEQVDTKSSTFDKRKRGLIIKFIICLSILILFCLSIYIHESNIVNINSFNTNSSNSNNTLNFIKNYSLIN